MRARRDNPSFTFFADDVLAWEPIAWLPDAALGQAFKLITYACKNGSTLPADHPLIGMLDPKIVNLCTTPVGDHLAVVRPCDLPRLMLDRQAYLEKRRVAAAAGGRRSVETRRQRTGSAQPDAGRGARSIGSEGRHTHGTRDDETEA